jgi:choline dehydrogenase-like flavoprotein
MTTATSRLHSPTAGCSVPTSTGPTRRNLSLNSVTGDSIGRGGKVLGGSSSINAMIYIRGHASIYDLWGEEAGSDWSFAELLRYFCRAEDQERGEDPWHGIGGPIRVADPRSPNPLSQAFVSACQELGFPRIPISTVRGKTERACTK